MLKSITISLFFLLACNLSLLAQPQKVFATQDSIWKRNYNNRIKKTKLFGNYIPKNIGDAHRSLSKLISPEARQKMMGMTEDQVQHKLFFSLGRWIIVNWGFEGGSRLSHSLKQLGLSHPEDMAVFVMLTYHRKLNHLPLNPKPLIVKLVAARKAEWQKRRRILK